MAAAGDVEGLIRQAAGEPDEEKRWQLIRVLQQRGDRDVLAGARRCAVSEDAPTRVAAADVLNQFRDGGPELHAEAIEVLAGLCGDAVPAVLAAAGVALAHEEDLRALPALLSVQHHPDARVRARVALSLSSLLGLGADEVVVGTLVDLSADIDTDVRDWASFGLMRCTIGNAAACEALVARVDDDDEVVAAQAVLGLARAGDERALVPLLAQLRSPRLHDWGSATYTGGHGVSDILEAAAELRDPRLHDDLVVLAFDRRWDPPTRAQLATAVERTRPTEPYSS